MNPGLFDRNRRVRVLLHFMGLPVPVRALAGGALGFAFGANAVLIGILIATVGVFALRELVVKPLLLFSAGDEDTGPKTGVIKSAKPRETNVQQAPPIFDVFDDDDDDLAA
jgi:hypothetical protein